MVKFRTIKGKVSRWFRRTLMKSKTTIKQGLPIFQEYADIYGESINSIEEAKTFFDDFIKEMGSSVNVDFLDTDNWDCIRRVEIDTENELIWLFWQVLDEDPDVNTMRKMILPLDYYGVCLKFDNIRFVREKKGKCYAICVNGYTLTEKNIKRIASANGWQVKGIDNNASFFSSSIVRIKDGESQFWRFMNTPITSFWIIPKSVEINPQKSKKFLYQIGVDKCEKQIKSVISNLEGSANLSKDEQKRILKTSGNEMRNTAESLFKLITCFYHEQYHFNVRNYCDLRLGDLTGPLKRTIYTSEFEQDSLGEIARIANELSHDTGNPVTMKDWGQLFILLKYFIDDFKSRIQRKGIEFLELENKKPSPGKYIKEHYNELCFLNEISSVVKESTGKISFTIEVNVDAFYDPFAEERLYLCSDGYIRRLSENQMKDALKVWSRDEVILLKYKIGEKVKQLCDNEGYDADLSTMYLSLDPVLKKEANPSHLFTEEEIKTLMLAANDEQNNKLVIDEEGYAHIIQDTSNGALYPVSQETWCSGNNYVGKDSPLSDLHDSYVLSINSWLLYLKTGCRIYDDLYVSDSGIEKVIEEIKKFYSE